MEAQRRQRLSSNNPDSKKNLSGYKDIAPVESVGGRVLLIRNSLRLNQRDFAKSLGTANPTISGIETGKIKPNFDFLAQLVSVYNVNPYYVLIGRGEKFKSSTKDTEQGIVLQEKFDSSIKEFLSVFTMSEFVRHTIMGQYRKIEKENRGLIDEQVENWKQTNI
jgi:transcriptional regulator with XRE-family HTH domain